MLRVVQATNPAALLAHKLSRGGGGVLYRQSSSPHGSNIQSYPCCLAERRTDPSRSPRASRPRSPRTSAMRRRRRQKSYFGSVFFRYGWLLHGFKVCRWTHFLISGACPHGFFAAWAARSHKARCLRVSHKVVSRDMTESFPAHLHSRADKCGTKATGGATSRSL